MLLPESDEVKRLGIFFFYDAQGVVDDYVTELLSGFMSSLSELTIVVNGKINETGKTKLLRYTDKLIVRKNIGFDAWAYKTALESYGWDKLEEFDEIILFNATIMGPVYPFTEMFTEMGNRDLDFWGITKFHTVEEDPFGRSPYDYLPEHIQSHFHAYRRSLHTSPQFKEYWDHLPPIDNYLDSVGLHESLFTKHFADLGFKWDVYVNTDDLEGYTYGPITFSITELVKNRRCPIFKRRSFFHGYGDVITQSVGNQASDLYKYLRDNTDFDVNLIWQNALRTMNIADLMKNLHLNHVLSQSIQAPVTHQHRIALVMHLYYMDLLNQTLEYVNSMPEGSDIILTVDSAEKAKIVKENAAHLPYHVEIRTIKNRGRDVSAFLIGGGKSLFNYDFVCFMHDKKVTQLTPQSIGDGFRYKCFENTLASPAYVSNVIRLFEDNPRLGIAMPTPPNHGDYFPNYTFTWGPNYSGTKDYLENTLDIHVPLDSKKEAVAPLGTMFWFRPEAFVGLLDRDWKYEDFPAEPNDIDNTVLHYIERAYAYVAQSNGYYPEYIFSDEFARIEFTNLSFELREMTRAISDPWIKSTLEETKGAVVDGKRFRTSLRRIIKNLIRRIPVLGPILIKIRKRRLSK